MTLVIDASAAVEYLLQTSLGMRVAGIVEAAELAAPELLDADVLAVLRREVLAARLDAARAREAVSDLRDWPLPGPGARRRRPQRPARLTELRGRIEDAQLGEVVAVEPAVAGEEGVALERRVGADQEVGSDAYAIGPTAAALRPPQRPGERGARGRDGVELNAERGERVVERPVVAEGGADLAPHDLAGNEGAAPIGVAQRFARPLAEYGIGRQDVEEDGGVDRRPHLLRAFRVRARAGRGPRISSIRGSTPRGSASVP